MYSNNRTGNRAAWARGFVALFAIILAMVLALAAFPAEAAPFAYVANLIAGSVSVIDTANNTVVATIPVGSGPFGVAVTQPPQTRRSPSLRTGNTSTLWIKVRTAFRCLTRPPTRW
jgi:YVTN family beta-propeller protein